MMLPTAFYDLEPYVRETLIELYTRADADPGKWHETTMAGMGRAYSLRIGAYRGFITDYEDEGLLASYSDESSTDYVDDFGTPHGAKKAVRRAMEAAIERDAEFDAWKVDHAKRKAEGKVSPVQVHDISEAEALIMNFKPSIMGLKEFEQTLGQAIIRRAIDDDR